MIRRRRPARPGSVRPARRPSSDDPTTHEGGFTLIELVIVLTVIPIVIAGLAAAIITSFKDQAGIYNRLSDSHDAQITSSYFVPDVESASFVNTNVAGVPCESIVAQVLLELTETAPGGQTEQIYYVDNTINYHPDSQQNAMLRIACNGTVPLGNNTIVAHSVTSATATVSCVTPAPVAPAPQAPWSPTWTPCTAAGGSALGVSSVALTVLEVPTTSGNVPLDSFTYSLTATPRAWVPETALATGGAPVPGLLLLGPNMRNGADLISFTGPATGQKLTTTASTPSGDIDVDSNSAGSVSMTGNDAISAAGNFNIYHCAASAGTACTNGAVSSTGTNNTVAPGPVSLATAVQDPLSNLPTPVVPSLSSAPPCTGQVGSTISISNQTITCQPGLYSSGLDITGTHDVITFVGGAGAEYQFGTPGCTGAHCALTGLIVTGANDTFNFSERHVRLRGCDRRCERLFVERFGGRQQGWDQPQRRRGHPPGQRSRCVPRHRRRPRRLRLWRDHRQHRRSLSHDNGPLSGNPSLR